MKLKRLLTPITTIAFTLAMLVSFQTQASAAYTNTAYGGFCQSVRDANTPLGVHVRVRTDIRMDNDQRFQRVDTLLQFYDNQTKLWSNDGARTVVLDRWTYGYTPSTWYYDNVRFYKAGFYYIRVTCGFLRNGYFSYYNADLGWFEVK